MTPDIVVLTDGSGYKDGYGGYAAVAYTPDKIWKLFRMAGVSGITVDRAEFTGMLEGLQLAWEMWNYMPGQQEGRKPTVQWFSDRENLILSARNIQSRSNCVDLWYRYDFYEERMDIIPTFVDVKMEKSMEDFNLVDVMSSTGREIMKVSLPQFQLPEAFLSEVFK